MQTHADESSLDNLEREAAQQAGAGNVAAAGEPAPADDPVANWCGTVAMGATLLVRFRPQLAPVLTDERQMELGQALAAVAVKYGWSMKSWLDQYAAEIALAVCVYGIGADCAKVLRTEEPAEGTAPDPAPRPAPTPNGTTLIEPNG